MNLIKKPIINGTNMMTKRIITKNKNNDFSMFNIDEAETNIKYNHEMIIGTAKHPEYIKLEGKYISLDKFQADDIDDLYDITHGSEEKELIWQFMFHGPFKNKGDMQDYYKNYVNSSERLVFCVRDKETNKSMGVICLMNIDTNTKNIELGGIWYPTKFQNTEANTEAIYLLTNYCIYQLGFRKIIWKCDNNNEKSKNAAIRLGFEFEGLFLRHMIVKNKNRDTAWYGLIPEKWIVLEKNYEEWLNKDKSSRPSLLKINSQVLQFSKVGIFNNK